jgi:hypothetical protein
LTRHRIVLYPLFGALGAVIAASLSRAPKTPAA